jgi:hypothetical protein
MHVFSSNQPNTVFMYVRFTPESGQKADLSRRPLCAKSRLTHRSKIAHYSITSSASASSGPLI